MRSSSCRRNCCANAASISARCRPASCPRAHGTGRIAHDFVHAAFDEAAKAVGEQRGRRRRFADRPPAVAAARGRYRLRPRRPGGDVCAGAGLYPRAFARSRPLHRPDLGRARLHQALSAHAVQRTRHDRRAITSGGRGCSIAARSWRRMPARRSPTSRSPGASRARRISAACSGSAMASCRPPSTRGSTSRRVPDET